MMRERERRRKEMELGEEDMPRSSGFIYATEMVLVLTGCWMGRDRSPTVLRGDKYGIAG